MKKMQLILICATLFFSAACKTEIKKTSNRKPDFKIGKQGFEENLHQYFQFEKMSVGTYFTTKNGSSKEQGLNLTFFKKDISTVSDSLLSVYSKDIQKEVAANLLFVEEYNYINITFENQQKKGNLIKTNSVKIRKELN